MPRRKPVKKDTTTVYPCWVSGNALTAGVEGRFNIKYAHRRNAGLGYRVRFDLLSDDAKRLVDVMTELALDLSDEHGYEDSRVQSIYRDLEKFPEAVQPR